MDSLIQTAVAVCGQLNFNVTTISNADHWLTTLKVSPTAAFNFSNAPGVETAISLALRDVLVSQKLSIEDVTGIIKMVTDAANNVTALNTLKNITADEIISCLQTVICLVAQAIMSPADYDVLKTILTPSFQLLRTVVNDRKNIWLSIRTLCVRMHCIKQC